MDINAAVSSDLGVAKAKLLAVVEESIPRDQFDHRELAALDYADAMTVGDVGNELFDLVAALFSDDEIVELTAAVAWENASARFNRALRVGSQQLWRQ